MKIVTYFSLDSLHMAIQDYTEDLELLWEVYDKAKERYRLRREAWEEINGRISD